MSKSVSECQTCELVWARQAALAEALQQLLESFPELSTMYSTASQQHVLANAAAVLEECK